MPVRPSATGAENGPASSQPWDFRPGRVLTRIERSAVRFMIRFLARFLA
jgi:hypothetical protein